MQAGQWGRMLLTLTLALPVTAAAKPKPKAPPVDAADPSPLTRLKAVVDKTAGVVDQFTRDVKAAGDDAQRLTDIGKRFQTQMQATEAEMESLQKAMDVAQRAAGEDYGRQKLGPRIEPMQAALELVQQAFESGNEDGPDADDDPLAKDGAPGAEKFRAEIAKVAGDADALQQQARTAGRDAAKREQVRQQLAKLGGQRNAAYQALRQDTGVTKPRKLLQLAEKTLEPKLVRVERLLRLALLPPCPIFEEEKLTVAEMAADARRLVDELPQVTDAAGLEALKGRFAQTVAGLDKLAWPKLSADERQELAALVTESVSASTDQFMTQADVLQQKFGTP